MISMLVVCFYPLILSRFGTINFVSNYTAVAGFFLLGSAELAIGVFASSLAGKSDHCGGYLLCPAVCIQYGAESVQFNL